MLYIVKKPLTGQTTMNKRRWDDSVSVDDALIDVTNNVVTVVTKGSISDEALERFKTAARSVEADESDARTSANTISSEPTVCTCPWYAKVFSDPFYAGMFFLATVVGTPVGLVVYSGWLLKLAKACF